MAKVNFDTPTMVLVDDISDQQMKWRNMPSVYATCRQVGEISEGDHLLWLKRIKKKDIQMFGIDVEGVNVGTCGLTSISFAHSTAEYSMLIGPEYQKKGYATRALGLLLDHAFVKLGLELVWGEIFDSNSSGLKIAQRLGFITEGMLRSRYKKKDYRLNTFIVSIMRNEWIQPLSRF